MAFVTPTPLAQARRTTFSRTSSRRPGVTRSIRRPTPRMIATEPQKTSTELSVRALELLSYVRGHKSIFNPGVGFNSTQATLCRKNDTAYAFTPLEELATNAYMLPGGSVAAFMVVQEEELVDVATKAAFKTAKTIQNDEKLSEIVSYDFRSIIRVVSYGSACKSVDFIHANNLGMMKMLHKEVGIPAEADVTGLEAAKEAVLAQITDSTLVDSTAACFDTVIAFMS